MRHFLYAQPLTTSICILSSTDIGKRDEVKIDQILCHRRELTKVEIFIAFTIELCLTWNQGQGQRVDEGQ